jgi:hypothetical protein
MTIKAVLSPNNKSWKDKLKDLPPIPKELEQYI